MSSSAIQNPKSKIQNLPFPDGVWFVPLTGVTVGMPNAEEAVVSAILQALQATPVGQRTPRQQLFSYLQPKQLLLVLDNFDHLPAATALLQGLLQSAPQLSLLVTAQNRLRLKAEVVIPLAGLSVPEQDNDPQAMEYESVRLLRERAGLKLALIGVNSIGDRQTKALVLVVCMRARVNRAW